MTYRLISKCEDRIKLVIVDLEAVISHIAPGGPSAVGELQGLLRSVVALYAFDLEVERAESYVKAATALAYSAAAMSTVDPFTECEVGLLTQAIAELEALA